jgi:hypothetical protein
MRRSGPSRKPDSALSRLMGVRVSVDVGGCPRDAEFREILVQACRSESGGVGVRWGRMWGQRSKSNWRLPVPTDVRRDGATGSRYSDRAVGATLGPVAHARRALTRKSRGTPSIHRGATG